MPRKPLTHSHCHYYHVTARSNNKEHFYLEKERIWRIMTFQLKLLQLEFDLRIGAFVLLDNHFHLLLLTPEEPIDRIMYFFMKRVTLKIQKESGRINKIFGGRYKGCIIREEAYLFNVYKYIYRNPVKAGLVSRVEDYQYSTFRDELLVTETLFFPEKRTPGELAWLNREFDKGSSESIQRSLKRTVFKLPQVTSPFGSF